MNIINIQDINVEENIKERVVAYLQTTQNLLNDNIAYYSRRPLDERDQTFYSCAGILKNSILKYEYVVKAFFQVGLIDSYNRQKICKYVTEMINRLDNNLEVQKYDA